ncbi:hypothetical protein [Candidatus Acidianus copahuensis]|uniref:hypothetical protein n=1 Tax=Candidatus Acidianus copahuensis TaxID=1160895 RepID=UPI0009DFE1F5|nr:hypothetical protein [Candidatus Acidianus copahuensis]
MVELYVENSKSKSGKHAIRTIIYKVDDRPMELKPSGKSVISTYKFGQAEMVTIKDKGTIVYIRLVKNIKNRVTGRIVVINNDNTVLTLKYRKMKLKRTSGDPSFYDKVKAVFDLLKVPVKRVNLK